MKPLLLGIVALSACTKIEDRPVRLLDGPVIPDAPVDAPPDAPDPNPGVTVTIQTSGTTPILVKYRDGMGEWKTPSSVTAGYSLTVRADYEVVVVCGDATGYETEILRAIVDDGDQQFIGCYAGQSGDSTVAITGTMVQPGTVAISDVASGTQANWHYHLDVTPGMHDLFAYNGSRVVLRRNLAITGAAVQPALDLATQGKALATVPITVAGTAAGDTVRSLYEVFTGNDFAFWDATGTSVKLAPTSVVQATDYQGVQVSAAAANTVRYSFQRYQGASTLAFTLLPRLSGITMTDTGASWSTLPAGELAFSLLSTTTQSQLTLRATPGWIGSATAVALDLAIPDYEEGWKVNGAHTRALAVSVQGPQSSSSTVYRETVDGGAKAGAPRSLWERELDRVRHAR